MDREQIYQWFVEHFGFTDDPSFAAKPVEHRALIFADQFTSALRRFYESALTPDPADDKALKEVLHSLYADYFVPIDLPMNNMLEGIIEGYGRSFIDLGADAFAKAIQKRSYGS